MKKAYFLLIACVFMLIIASIPDALCYPPAGVDHMDPTKATIELQIIGMFNETIIVKGPTKVSRSSPYDPGDGHWIIDTEIISMSLTGVSSNVGPITIIKSPSKTSNGKIRQVQKGIDYPATSFFNVFVEIMTALVHPLSTLHNDDPVIMNATINSIPPWGSTYTSPFGPIPLKDENGNIIGFIKHVSHEIPIPSVGGLTYVVHRPRPLDPYIGLTCTIVIATVATAVWAKGVKCRKEKKRTPSMEAPL